MGVVLLYDLNDSKAAIRAWKELIEVNPFARAHGNELVVDLIEKISNHARRTWYDEAPSKGAKNHWDPFYGANPINCGFIETCTFIRVLHFQFLFRIYCFEKSVLNICTL